MIKFILTSFLFIVAQISPAQEWQPLFDGKTLDQWVVKCKPADQDTTFWSVEDGAIVADSLDHKGHDYVWLMSKEEFTNFELQLKFQAFKDSPGNSGVQIRSRYDDEAGWLDGPQIDINPPGPWRTGMMWDETRGNQRWIFPNIPKGKWVDESMALSEAPFYYSNDTPAWNTLRIIADRMTIKAFLNNVQITDFDGSGILDDETHQQRNVGQSGHIALQIHKGDQLRIKFKDVKIKHFD